MPRVRPGVELVRAILVPTSEFRRLDLPTLERPRKAISGRSGAGKCDTSVAAARNRDRTRMLQFAMEGRIWQAWSGKRREQRPARDQLAHVGTIMWGRRP